MEWIVLVGTCADALVVSAVAIEASHPRAGVFLFGLLGAGLAVWALAVGALWLGAAAILASIVWIALRMPLTKPSQRHAGTVGIIAGAGVLVAGAVAIAENTTRGKLPQLLPMVTPQWELVALAACALIITGTVGVRALLLETEEELHRTQAQRARLRRRELQERQRIARKEAIALRREEVARKRNQQ